MRSRSKTADTATAEEADELGRSLVLDLGADENIESIDTVAGASEEGETESGNRRLLDMARAADKLRGDEGMKVDNFVPVNDNRLTRESGSLNCNPKLASLIVSVNRFWLDVSSD